MVDDFINRKHGRAKVDYPHPALEPILKPTYGVILYQEQVMQIAQVLAGYTLGGADLLRRAMGKKKPEEMAKQREIFVSGALQPTASMRRRRPTSFDLMEKFAGYGFNKSHSAAYALLSYQTAWLKAHYPALHGGGAVGRHGQHRQGGDPDRRMPEPGADGAAAGCEHLGLSLHRRRRPHHPLWLGAIKGVGRPRSKG